MKHLIYIIFTMLSIFAMQNCNNSDDTVGPTQIDTTPPQLTVLDHWLRETFTTPYNIEIQYKWNINETDVARYLHPPYAASVKSAAEVLLKAWIEPYTKVGGEDFIKTLAPRQITFAGSFNYNPNSLTTTLGLAEAGTKITLFNIDYLDFTDINSIREPMETVQHEYGHILNQTRPIDPAFGLVNPQNYSAQWMNRSLAKARSLGYITPYASSSETEDFVEMVATMLTNSKEDFDAIVNGIQSSTAKYYIRKKEQMVVDYYKKEFGIDIYELQALTEAAIKALVQ